MYFRALLLAASLSAYSLAQVVDNGDVPRQCRDVCSSVISLARDCDQRFSTDREERNCICTASNANTQIPTCAACVTQFTDDDDNDLRDLVRDCAFQTTTFNPSATSAPTSAVLSASSVLVSLLSSVTAGGSSTTTTGTNLVPTSAAAGSSVASVVSPGAAARQTGLSSLGMGALGVLVVGGLL